MNKKIIFAILGAVILLILFVLLINFLGPKAKLNITSKPEKIDIYINNVKYETPVTISGIKKKELIVYGSKEGYDLYVQTVQIQKGKEQSLLVEMSPIGEEPPEGAPISDIKGPEIKDLPYENDHFRVDWDSAYGKYLLVPKIPFDMSQPPEDFFKQYWSDYESYAKEALKWIEQQGVKPTNKNIEWWGEEWWPENATAPTL